MLQSTTGLPSLPFSISSSGRKQASNLSSQSPNPDLPFSSSSSSSIFFIYIQAVIAVVEVNHHHSQAVFARPLQTSNVCHSKAAHLQPSPIGVHLASTLRVAYYYYKPTPPNQPGSNMATFWLAYVNLSRPLRRVCRKVPLGPVPSQSHKFTPMISIEVACGALTDR